MWMSKDWYCRPYASEWTSEVVILVWIALASTTCSNTGMSSQEISTIGLDTYCYDFKKLFSTHVEQVFFY